MAKIGWEIMKHPPCSSDLVPSDFHLFRPMKVHLGGGGQKFVIGDELKHGVLNWLHSEGKILYVLESATCQGDGESFKVVGELNL